VVLACAKVVQSALSCDVNENYFDLSEVNMVYIFIILILYYTIILYYELYSSIILLLPEHGN